MSRLAPTPERSSARSEFCPFLAAMVCWAHSLPPAVTITPEKPKMSLGICIFLLFSQTQRNCSGLCHLAFNNPQTKVFPESPFFPQRYLWASSCFQSCSRTSTQLSPFYIISIHGIREVISKEEQENSHFMAWVFLAINPKTASKITGYWKLKDQ